ncbi:ribosomal protein S5 domain 2-type protein [Lipomyces oligophaga]|uniref:ribosomal protein S5 domain 2-type protein n=1 Tax=Lipomyces oligophaga TaxID=45792 RepID=UPI0034CFC7C5
MNAISQIESTFVRRALVDGIRLDNRSLSQVREIGIKFSTSEYGVVDVHIGQTRVIVRISAEVTQPRPERPYDGIFLISSEISPMAVPTYDTNKKTEEELVISRIIEKSIRQSGALDLESLCIISAEKCWLVRADVNFLDHDGGLLDAACLAVSAALLHFRRPEVSIVGTGTKREVIVHPISEKVPVPLAVLHAPICTTFSFFNLDLEQTGGAVSSSSAISKHNEDEDEDMEDRQENIAILVDATLQEEKLRHGFMAVTANCNKEICQIYKAGELAVDGETLLNCAESAMLVAERVTKLINKKLKEDEKLRDVNGMLKEARAENDR